MLRGRKVHTYIPPQYLPTISFYMSRISEQTRCTSTTSMPQTAHWSPAKTPEVTVSRGSGPRHFTLHPNGKFAYLAEELTSSVCAFSVNKTTGALSILQDTVRSLPMEFNAANTSADIHTDLNGKYLYMSNRGLNALSIFSIAPNGKVTLIRSTGNGKNSTKLSGGSQRRVCVCCQPGWRYDHDVPNK